MMLVTLSKQCIHFFRSDRCPPTSNMCILRPVAHVSNARTVSRASRSDGWMGKGKGKEGCTHDNGPNENRVSVIPLLVARARSTSVSVGT